MIHKAEIVKEIMDEKIQSWNILYEKENIALDLISEMESIVTQMMISFYFGKKSDILLVPQYHQGVLSQTNISTALKVEMMFCLSRGFVRKEVLILPKINDFFYTNQDKEHLMNCKLLREYFNELVLQRKSNPEQFNEHDIIKLLLEDPEIKGNPDLVTDDLFAVMAATF